MEGRSLALRLGQVWSLCPPSPRSPAIISSLRKARASACWSVCKAREWGHHGRRHRVREPLTQRRPGGTGVQGDPLPSWKTMLCQAEPWLLAIPAAPVPLRHLRGWWAVGSRLLGAPHQPGGLMTQWQLSLYAALASQARSTIFVISSAPLIGTSGAMATGTCRPRLSFSWRRGPYAEPAAMPCRMTQRSAFSHSLPPPPPRSPELQPGLIRRPQAPAPLGQPHSPPRNTSCGDPVLPGHLPALTQHGQPGPGNCLPITICEDTLAARFPRAPAVPLGSCSAQHLQPYRISPWRAAHDTQHAAHGTRHTAAWGLLPLKPFLLLPSHRESPPPAAEAPRSSLVPLAPQFVASPLPGVPPATGPPATAAYQLPGGNPAPLIGKGRILPNLAKALLAKSWGLNVGLKPG